METGIALLMPPKLCWFTQPEKDHVDPGETADMASKGGGLCVPSWGLAHIWNIPKFHSHKTNNSELIISLIRH